MGVRDVIRALVSPHQRFADETQRRMADVEAAIAHVTQHAQELDDRIDQAEVRMTRLEARLENRRRRLRGPEDDP